MRNIFLPPFAATYITSREAKETVVSRDELSQDLIRDARGIVRLFRHCIS